ncbi:pseudouridine synthase [Geranomyces variabilis]|nr:pseudouridine synthase [Geranomyces variabilis]KAJ3132781.1 tRNA pseudouridine synthase 1 [Geranomyces variabilis]
MDDPAGINAPANAALSPVAGEKRHCEEPPAEQAAKKAKPEDSADNASGDESVAVLIDNDSEEEKAPAKKGKKGKAGKNAKKQNQPKSKNKPGRDTNWERREPRPEGSDPKLPKRKVALLMGYCGTGYNGMQINPGVVTLESELHKALAAAGAVSKDNADNPAKINFMRAARTDKGVHAAGQVCSLKMIIEDEEVVNKINANLPEQIRVWGFVRTNNSFHAKNACDSRIYEYFLPTYVLTPVDPARYPKSQRAKDLGGNFAPLGQLYDELPKSTESELATRRQFRISEAQLTLLRDLLGMFVGTHNCHNFTVNKGFNDKSANRFIMSFGVSEPIIRGGIEWVRCTVHGQSFMLHQIRKMIGIAILAVRTGAPAKIIQQAFGNMKLNVPKAPALGLLLERTVYKAYNEKWANESQDRLEPIDFDKYKDTIDAFKEKWIYSRLVEEELATAQFDEWNRIIDSRSMDFEWFLTADGVDIASKPDLTINRPREPVPDSSDPAAAVADAVADSDNDEGGDE